jgi:hypothetical protein
MMMPETRCAARSSVCVLVGLLLCQTVQASERTLERQLLKQAPLILEKLREQGCKNIGVLKFRVQKAGGRATDNGGTLNTFLAERLEVALTLSIPPNDNKAQNWRSCHQPPSVAGNLCPTRKL